jgi:predicted cupin superfamily sugar epimerase
VPTHAAPTDPRALALLDALGLAPHPEGGWYREVFRSAAATTIYFLLADGAHSRWHRVTSDEVWHHYEGAPLELLVIDPDLRGLQRLVLGAVDPHGDARPVHTVPAGWWQAARTLGAHTLVGCTVAPAFRFEDFALLDDRPEEARELRERFDEVRVLG